MGVHPGEQRSQATVVLPGAGVRDPIESSWRVEPTSPEPLMTGGPELMGPGVTGALSSVAAGKLAGSMPLTGARELVAVTTARRRIPGSSPVGV
jgi:hypothetical protein